MRKETEEEFISKVKLTDRQKRQLQSVLKDIYENDPRVHPDVKKGMLSFTSRVKTRIDDIFDRKEKVNDTYKFFKPYYELAGLELTKKDAESIRYNVVTFAKKLRQIADDREIDNG